MIHRLTAPVLPAGEAVLRLGDDLVEVRAGNDDDARLVSGKGRPAKLAVIDVGDASVENVPAAGARLVYADRFDAEDLAVLRRRGWCGLDRTGQILLATRPLVVSVERSERTPAPAPTDGATLARLRGHAVEKDAAAVRGAVSARLTQLLLESPGKRWRPSDLAAEDGRATIATASRLLAELRRLGLCTVSSTRQSRLYSVVDAELLLRWLAERTPPLDRRTTLDGYLRVSDADQLVDRVVDGLERLPVSAVLTGSAAVFVENRHITTSIPVVVVRVDPTYELGPAAAELGLQPGNRAGNVRLVSDRGYLGTTHPRRLRGVPLAGLVRTWLDLRHERRGDDAADLYYDTVRAALQAPRSRR